MTLTKDDILEATEQVVQTFGAFKLYTDGIQPLINSTTISTIYDKAEKTPGEELVEVFYSALEENENTDVLIEDLIEHLGNVTSYTGFEYIIKDEDISDHAPIYLLEKWGQI